MSKQRITDPCYELEDKEGKQTDGIIKTLNQTIIIKITITTMMITVEITKTKTVIKITCKEMKDKDQTDNSQIDQTDNMDHITKEIDNQTSKTIKKEFD